MNQYLGAKNCIYISGNIVNCSAQDHLHQHWEGLLYLFIRSFLIYSVVSGLSWHVILNSITRFQRASVGITLEMV